MSFSAPDRRQVGTLGLGCPEESSVAGRQPGNSTFGRTCQTRRVPTESTDLVPTAVFGRTAFCEIGTPSALATSSNGLLAVGGSLGPAQWNGFDMGAGPVNGTGPLRGWNRCGVYGADATCLALVPSRWPVRCASFNAEGSLLAIGTGSYDGGYCFEGELLIIDLTSGGCRSVLESSREVLEVEWIDSQRIRVVVSPAYEEDEPQEPSEFTLLADDWSSVPRRSIAFAADPRYLVAYEPSKPDDVARALAQIASDAGLPFGSRRQVWAVEATDFGVLAALEGVELEAWESSGALRYRREADGRGRQIERPDAQSAVTNVEPRWGGPQTGFERSPSVVNVVDVATGRTVAPLITDAPMVVTSAGGMTLLRASDAWRKSGDRSWVTDEPNGSARTDVPLDGYDLFNHYFAIRRAPHLLALQGGSDRPSADKWVVRLAQRRAAWRKSIAMERLFALEWDRERNGHLMGGPGVFVDDASGQAIVHSGRIHNGAGLLAGNAFVVHRRYPSGEVSWHYRADCQATSVDEVDGTVVVAFADGRIVRLDVGTGDVLRTQELRVDGHSVVPLSLCCAPGVGTYIGTMDGRILLVE
jgi:hypothetical protein